MSNERIALTNDDLHDHLRNRMAQRGVSLAEIERALNEGWDAANAKPGTHGKVFVFEYGDKWEGSVYAEKEVAVYYKMIDVGMVILTVVARYGNAFHRG